AHLGGGGGEGVDPGRVDAGDAPHAAGGELLAGVPRVDGEAVVVRGDLGDGARVARGGAEVVGGVARAGFVLVGGGEGEAVVGGVVVGVGAPGELGGVTDGDGGLVGVERGDGRQGGGDRDAFRVDAAWVAFDGERVRSGGL